MCGHAFISFLRGSFHLVEWQCGHCRGLMVRLYQMYPHLRHFDCGSSAGFCSFLLGFFIFGSSDYYVNHILAYKLARAFEEKGVLSQTEWEKRIKERVTVK